MRMDSQISEDIAAMAAELVQRYSERFAAAGKLIEIETLSEQIGDELSRQLASCELSHRSLEAFQAKFHDCPTCGRTWPIETDPEPVLLQGTRGEIESTEPRCHCKKCRRDFFPSVPPAQPTGA